MDSMPGSETEQAEYAIGIDLGGTNVKCIVAQSDGAILRRLSFETLHPSEVEASAEAPCHSTRAEPIRRVVDTLQEEQCRPASWIGLAAPGLAAQDGRCIAYMPGRLNWLEGLDWTTALHSSVPVAVLNDSHAALLGEVWQGAAHSLQDVILLTLGTGVGGAIVSGGRLLKGHIGRAGHLGHLCLDPNGPPDICSTPGSLEDAIGECTLENRSGGRYTSTRTLIEDVEKGDPDASGIWTRSVRALACGIASLVNILDPEAVVIGGGIAAAGPLLFERLHQVLTEVEWRPGGHEVRILPAAAGEYAGALGAVYHAIIDRP